MKSLWLLEAVLSVLPLAAWQGMGALPSPPEPSRRNDVAAALMQSEHPPEPARHLRILLLSDKKDHGENAHDYPLWQERWAALLGGPKASTATQLNLFGPPTAPSQSISGAKNVQVMSARAWPTDDQLATADVLVAFCYLSWTDEHKRQLKHFLQRGAGLVLIHSAVWTKPQANAEVANLVGVGGFTRFRHGPVQLEITAPEHPICKGLPTRVQLYDETYWPPTPPVPADRFTTLAVSREKTDATGDQNSPQPIFWVCSSAQSRVFGCVLGHYTWTFDDPWFRLLVLRGIAWAAGESPYRFDALTLQGARVAEP